MGCRAMFRSWRVQLREAEDAVRGGRLDEAEQLICGGDLRQYRPGKQLAAEVAGKIAERGRRRILRGELSDGWRDVETSCSLAGRTEGLLTLRQEMIDHVLHMAEADIAAGEPAKAVSRLDSIGRRAAAPEAVRRLQETARRLAAAERGGRGGRSSPRRGAQLGPAAPAAMAPPEGTGLDGAGPAAGRFMLWVDGVGGYLVCLQDSVRLGLATPGNAIEIPIMGDLSRQHARLRREDGYLIEPLQSVRVNGRRIRGPANLSDGDEIELGEGVRLRFRQPHSLSATARLEFLSRHRTEPSAAGILLMAESCVLGPKWQDHVVCREWSQDVVLFRRDERLFCRALEPLDVDGRRCEGQTPVAPGAHVEGSDFSFCLRQVA